MLGDASLARYITGLDLSKLLAESPELLKAIAGKRKAALVLAKRWGEAGIGAPAVVIEQLRGALGELSESVGALSGLVGTK
jgi:hypothetical protein